MLMLVNTARVALLTIAVSVAQSTFASTAQPVDLSPDRQRIHVPRNEAAIAQIPAGFKFAQPGKFTVAVSGVAGPPLALLANDDKTTIGSEADTAQLVADSLGLQLNVVQTSWEDWPLGVSSGKYDAVISNVTVTEARKKRFDFATYRQDVLGFYVKTNSKISEIKQASDIAGLKIIVGSGTNQEKVLLAWNEANEKAGIKPALLQYFDDQAAAQLAIQSGRSDALFGPNSVYAYSAAITGGIKRVGTVNGGWPLQADIAVTTRKDNGLVKPIHTALEGAIAGASVAALGPGCGARRQVADQPARLTGLRPSREQMTWD
ncbi:Amino acid ABC transporter periplasmic amino acid-binding protein [Pseudomonas savastanoi pv. glycinea]|uniref:Amino acid ABC transporter periplasmic amino acid-binding protein n=3 Tax=Pseudomonas syringae group TaxID=136849 RepID=A0A3M3FG59_PSESG|nr:Amino acid ABC transporter periplasmic amino acid-binding protein [Pseudomonas savastanoi pv. glycinea]RMQ49970.1 Amino acid ABC transporter periplasmic amino acid-binding protein [Pseudomonas savastanoi pv. phaseolicola]